MVKLLLVEDNEMNPDMLVRRQERRDYQVVSAIDGDQGVRLAQAESPDFILRDMSLRCWTAGRRPGLGASDLLPRKKETRYGAGNTLLGVGRDAQLGVPGG
jgi:CheY-like chemotaxis protein